MNNDEIIMRAADAKKLLEHPLLEEALRLIDAEIISVWESCPSRDKEGREELWRLKKTATKFRGILQGVVESGQLAEHALREQKNFVGRAMQAIRK